MKRFQGLVLALATSSLLFLGTACSNSSDSTSSTTTGAPVTTTTVAPVTTTTTPQPVSISADEASNFIGSTKTVKYFVTYTGSSNAGTEFLDQKVDYKNGFATVIFASDVSNFPQDPIAKYGHHTILVTGEIQTYNGMVEIVASNPSQISIAN